MKPNDLTLVLGLLLACHTVNRNDVPEDEQASFDQHWRETRYFALQLESNPDNTFTTGLTYHSIDDILGRMICTKKWDGPGGRDHKRKTISDECDCRTCKLVRQLRALLKAKIKEETK